MSVNLILHIGRNKVGSSTLQYVLNKNFVNLLELGFYYPQHQVPKNINHGSVGNSFDLAIYLKHKKWQKISNLISKHIVSAHIHSCHTLILSCESIYHFMSNDSFNEIKKIFLHNELKNIDIVFFDKNLFSHSLSCYNHRIGTNIFTSYECWLLRKYEGFHDNNTIVNFDQLCNRNSFNYHYFIDKKNIISHFEKIFNLKLQNHNAIVSNKSISLIQGYFLSNIAKKSVIKCIIYKIYFKSSKHISNSHHENLVLKYYKSIYDQDTCNQKFFKLQLNNVINDIFIIHERISLLFIIKNFKNILKAYIKYLFPYFFKFDLLLFQIKYTWQKK